jgi:hypothetical protein
MQCDFPALVRGQDPSGKKYRINGQLCNMSASGLYLLSQVEIQTGDELVVNITMTSSSKVGARQLSAHCLVLRSDAIDANTYGIALSILSYRFL